MVCSMGDKGNKFYKKRKEREPSVKHKEQRPTIFLVISEAICSLPDTFGTGPKDLRCFMGDRM